MDIKNIIGKNISLLRKDKQLSQSGLADILEKKVSVVSSYETGKTLPPVDVLNQIAIHFKIELSVLVNEDLSKKGISEWVNEKGEAIDSPFDPVNMIKSDLFNRYKLNHNHLILIKESLIIATKLNPTNDSRLKAMFVLIDEFVEIGNSGQHFLFNDSKLEALNNQIEIIIEKTHPYLINEYKSIRLKNNITEVNLSDVFN